MTRADLLALGLGALAIAAAVFLVGVAAFGLPHRSDAARRRRAILAAGVASFLSGAVLMGLYLAFGAAALLFGLAALLFAALAVVSLRDVQAECE